MIVYVSNDDSGRDDFDGASQIGEFPVEPSQFAIPEVLPSNVEEDASILQQYDFNKPRSYFATTRRLSTFHGKVTQKLTGALVRLSHFSDVRVLGDTIVLTLEWRDPEAPYSVTLDIDFWDGNNYVLKEGWKVQTKLLWSS